MAGAAGLDRHRGEGRDPGLRRVDTPTTVNHFTVIPENVRALRQWQTTSVIRRKLALRSSLFALCCEAELPIGCAARVTFLCLPKEK
jgi:hypothetical protein